jgi:hypothetical protein
MMNCTSRWLRIIAPSCAALGIVLLVVASAVAGDTPAHGRHDFSRVRHRVIVGIGPWWWGPYPWGPYPYSWYYPPYYAYPPTVIVEEPPVYIQQPAPPPSPPAEQYWYYCRSAGAYYPTVPTCPEDWLKVPPRAG